MTSFFSSTVGLPELPPCVSVVVTKLYGVDKFSLSLASSHRCGNLYGSTPVARL